MARLNVDTRTANRTSSHTTESSASSRSASVVESDKENQQRRTSAQKRRSDQGMASTQNAAKRRKTGNQQSQGKGGDKIGTKYYDPHQDVEERRRTKKAIRELHSNLNESRQEFLQANSTGLIDTVTAANRHFENIKQTADATVDARLLVAAADLSYKKINTLTLGDSSVGIDVDDFVTKCIGFMKYDDDDEEARPGSTQTQRRRRQQIADDDDDDSGDVLNWNLLGRNAALRYNSRPALSGFLLGPLSVQKKVRQNTQRRAREERGEPTQRSRTLQLTEDELDNQEKQNLTKICTGVYQLLRDTQDAGEKNIEDQWLERCIADMSDDDAAVAIKTLFDENNLRSNGAVPLFKFCFNPQSFGQTVENLFYVSFLVKEGRAGIMYDSDGMPTIGTAQDRNMAQRQAAPRNQAVFTLSFDVWREVIESFEIKKSIIPHRKEEVYDDGVLPAQDEAEDSDMYN